MTESKTPSFLISTRFLLAIVAFLGYCLQYMLKINLGIAIVCMVNDSPAKSGNFTLYNETNTTAREAFEHRWTLAQRLGLSSPVSANSSGEVVCRLSSTGSGTKLVGDFYWSKSTQGIILASYFYGYIITLPGGYLSFKFGPKNVLGYSMLACSLFTIVLPFCARANFIALIFCRFLTGLAHGLFWPAMASMFVFWVTSSERTRIVGSSTSGAHVGNIVALPLSGYLCVNGFDSGWPSIFYIFGILGVAWFVVFMLVCYNSPETHPFISEAERKYLMEGTKKEVSVFENAKHKPKPWKEILTSKIVIGIIVGHFANNWGNYLFVTQLPSFMKDVLKFDIKSNGVYSAIPYIACAVATCLLGIVCDKIIKLNIRCLPRHNVRRLYAAFGYYVPMICVICLAFVDCSQPYIGVLLLSLALGFNGFFWSGGPLTNINDVAGSYSGIVFGVVNTFGTIPGIICPYIVGVITTHKTQAEWQIVFFICGAIYFVGGTFYIIVCTSEIQPWAVAEAKPEAEDEDNPKKLHAYTNEALVFDSVSMSSEKF